MKKLFFYLAGLLLLTAFPACSDDDEPAKEETTGFITKVKVETISKENPTPTPLEGVTVTAYYEYYEDENGNVNAGNVIATIQTNAEGVAIIEHEQNAIYFTLNKEGYSDTDEDGLLVFGIDEEGNYIHIDINGDGVLDERDSSWYVYQSHHDDEDPDDRVREEGPFYMIPVE